MSNYERINWTTGTKVKEGYTIINGQEYQTVQPEYSGETPINVANLNHMDKQLEDVSVDYITEIGNDETWAWRKWKSGWVELYAYHQFTGLNLTSTSMGTYYGPAQNINLPFQLTDVYYSDAREVSVRGSGVYVYDIGFIDNNTVISTQFRAHASSTNANCGVKFYILGTYEVE